MTNPHLSLSNGIDALIGSSALESAVMEINPDTFVSQIGDSAPPATMTSASPACIYL